MYDTFTATKDVDEYLVIKGVKLNGVLVIDDTTKLLELKYKTKTPDFNISGLKTFNGTGEEKDGIVTNTDGSSLEIDDTTGKLQVKDTGIDTDKLKYDANYFKPGTNKELE